MTKAASGKDYSFFPERSVILFGALGSVFVETWSQKQPSAQIPSLWGKKNKLFLKVIYLFLKYDA